MKEIITWIKALVVVTTISITMAHPTSEEPARNGKDVSPVMQSLLTDIARELISRSTSSNQVLTLNFANMLILLVLKGLLWGASYAGTAAGYPKGRSEDETPEPLITETEILLLLSYLMGDDENNFDCLHRIACEDPFKAREYMNAGHIVMNAAKFIGLNNASDQKYSKMLNQLQEVIKYKENGGICERRYSCNQNENENTI